MHLSVCHLLQSDLVKDAVQSLLAQLLPHVSC